MNSKTSWLEVGLKLLVEQGPQALTLERLCRAAKKTKGSFYHHFPDVPTYQQALLEHWESTHTLDLIAATEKEPARDGLLKLIDLITKLAIGPEKAFRAWADSNPMAAEVVTRVDQKRVEHLVQLRRAQGGQQADLEPQAWIDYATFLGLNLLTNSMPRGQRRKVHLQFLGPLKTDSKGDHQ